MAIPTPVNGQITDAVTQSNVQVLASAPAQAMGSLFQAMAQAASTAAQNAVSSQQQLNVIGQAATTSCVKMLVGAEESK